jgi:sporulation protein YlmC with PRC-barrel domain
MMHRATNVIGKTVLADGGKKLGKVTDLLLDEADHRLVGLVVHHGAFRSEAVLPADAIRSVGPDAVVSRSDALVGAKEWRQQQG